MDWVGSRGCSSGGKRCSFPRQGPKSRAEQRRHKQCSEEHGRPAMFTLRRKIHQLKLLFGCREGTQRSPKHQGGDRSAGCLPCSHGARAVGEKTEPPHIHALVQPSFRTFSITTLQLANSSLVLRLDTGPLLDAPHDPLPHQPLFLVSVFSASSTGSCPQQRLRYVIHAHTSEG